MNAKCVSVLDALKEIIEHHGADEPGVHSLVLAHADIAELIAADEEYDSARVALSELPTHSPIPVGRRTWERMVDAEARRFKALARVKGE